MNMPHAANVAIKSVKNPGGPRHAERQPLRRIIRVAALVVILLCVGFGAKRIYNKLCRSDFFQITAVRIAGNRMTSKEQITALSRVDIHSNLLAINPFQVQSLLESHPWIKRAEVIRDWPNRLLINVQEKTPVALLNRESGLFYLDGGGQTIAAASRSQELDFPVITGLEKFSLSNSNPAQIPEPLQDIYDLLKVANRNNPILPEQNISEIHVTENGELIIFLLERPFPIYFGNDGKISTRYYRLVKVLNDL